MAGSDTPAYLDSDRPIEERARDLVSRMTLAEKVSQMVHQAPGVERLGVPEYDWWGEALHGVARAGVATVFPQAIALAATWDVPLMGRVAEAIGVEARAKHHEFLRRGERGQYKGLTFWSPNVNVVRDPRWGRGHETYGECPYLAARMGVAFVKGLQGSDDRYLTAAACAKHYAVHSGPESLRHTFDAVVCERDLRETYLPAFKALVKEAGVESVMGAYNRTNGEACCASSRLLGGILRGEWGFRGHVVSDCGAIGDIFRNHHLVETAEEAAALAVKAGCDLNCGGTYASLVAAVEGGLITEEEVDVSVRRLFRTRFRLGMFDPPERVPQAATPPEANDSAEHRELARVAAREAVVLLKNEACLGDRALLPLSGDVKRLAVVGPTAEFLPVLLGNYYGDPSSHVTPLAGIRARAKAAGTEVGFAAGCELTGGGTDGFTEALELARGADVIVAILGSSPTIEGEEGEVADSDGGGDRRHIDLPGRQQELLEALHATGKPLCLVLTGGSALAVGWADREVPAILMSWYSGEEGGTGLADVLFGDHSPAGRLPVTFYESLDQVPDFHDYAMKGRTYRYMTEEPLYRFGYGLSYSSFAYSGLDVAGEVEAGAPVAVSVRVRNAGGVAADEVVQVYVTNLDAKVPVPVRQLADLARLHLLPGAEESVALRVAPEQTSVIDDDGRRRVHAGAFRISVGGSQPGDPKAASRGVASPLEGDFRVAGGPVELEP